MHPLRSLPVEASRCHPPSSWPRAFLASGPGVASAGWAIVSQSGGSCRSSLRPRRRRLEQAARTAGQPGEDHQVGVTVEALIQAGIPADEIVAVAARRRAGRHLAYRPEASPGPSRARRGRGRQVAGDRQLGAATRRGRRSDRAGSGRRHQRRRLPRRHARRGATPRHGPHRRPRRGLPGGHRPGRRHRRKARGLSQRTGIHPRPLPAVPGSLDRGRLGRDPGHRYGIGTVRRRRADGVRPGGGGCPAARSSGFRPGPAYPEASTLCNSSLAPRAVWP